MLQYISFIKSGVLDIELVGGSIEGVCGVSREGAVVLVSVVRGYMVSIVRGYMCLCIWVYGEGGFGRVCSEGVYGKGCMVSMVRGAMAMILVCIVGGMVRGALESMSRSPTHARPHARARPRARTHAHVLAFDRFHLHL